MPASVPSQIIHAAGPVYQFGLTQEADHMFLHEITDSATRQRISITNDDTGVEEVVSYVTANIRYNLNCHVRAQRGVQNTHPGRSLTGAALQLILQGSEAPFGFDNFNGYFILNNPTRSRRAGEFHEVTFEVEQIFPEGESYNNSYAADIGMLAAPVDLGGATLVDTDTGTVIPDPGTGTEAFRTMVIHYHFEPLPGSPAGDRDGYIVRFLNRTTTPSLAQLYATGNPPGEYWQSTPSNEASLPSGPAYDADDVIADSNTSIPGHYYLTGVYELESDTWLDDDITGGVYPLVGSPFEFDTATHGTDVIIVTYLDSTVRRVIGNLPNKAAVLTELGLADDTTLARIYRARTNTYDMGSSATDELNFWRATTVQPVSLGFLQVYEVFGSRTTGKFSFIRASYNKWDTTWATTNANFPTPPPATHYNIGTTVASYPLSTLDASYNASGNTYPIGNSSAVTALGYPAPAVGKDLWLFKRGSGYGALSGTADWLRGDFANLAAFCTYYSLTNTPANLASKFTWLFHANGSSGAGNWHVGSEILSGDPFAQVVGVSKF